MLLVLLAYLQQQVLLPPVGGRRLGWLLDLYRALPHMCGNRGAPRQDTRYSNTPAIVSAPIRDGAAHVTSVEQDILPKPCFDEF